MLLVRLPTTEILTTSLRAFMKKQLDVGNDLNNSKKLLCNTPSIYPIYVVLETVTQIFVIKSYIFSFLCKNEININTKGILQFFVLCSKENVINVRKLFKLNSKIHILNFDQLICRNTIAIYFTGMKSPLYIPIFFCAVFNSGNFISFTHVVFVLSNFFSLHCVLDR